ncbi:MAG: hypothetical protein HQ481_17600 [Alphaproteobacteria bacterium]|nr:hypothetical protein [Alphaproteobacteria bacterium]
MSLAGQGAVAIWHDLDREARDEFYAWHGEEHMPERVGIPGFLRGRRYVAIRADLEFFNLYEALSPEVVKGADYQNRLNNPTPWTRSTVTHFRNVARSLCRVAATFGRGQGGLAATWRYDVAEDEQERHRRAMAERILPAIAGRRGVAGVHLLIADPEASAVDTEERKVRAEKNKVPRWIVIVEGWGDAADFEALCQSVLPDATLLASGAATPIAVDVYRLQTVRTKTDWT